MSRYKFDRSQKTVMVQDLNCLQVSVSGCKNHYEFVLGVGVKAKSSTTDYTFLADKGVIIASGGFGSNVEMRIKYNNLDTNYQKKEI